jgi:hypothetical protein
MGWGELQEEYYLFFRKGRWVALHIVSLGDWSEFKGAMETLAKSLADKL